MSDCRKKRLCRRIRTKPGADIHDAAVSIQRQTNPYGNPVCTPDKHRNPCRISASDSPVLRIADAACNAADSGFGKNAKHKGIRCLRWSGGGNCAGYYPDKGRIRMVCDLGRRDIPIRRNELENLPANRRIASQLCADADARWRMGNLDWDYGRNCLSAETGRARPLATHSHLHSEPRNGLHLLYSPTQQRNILVWNGRWRNPAILSSRFVTRSGHIRGDNHAGR